jgi:serine/threonine-protein kinase
VSHANFSSLTPDTVLLDRYRVIRGVGRGGFGTVYLAEDQAIGEEIILKVLNPQFSADENVERRFVQELKLTRKITHKNVIRIFDFMDLGGAHAVSMEYFPGRDLGKVLAEDAPLPASRSLGILAQVCEGLAAAHAVGVIHRDIKPANILIGRGDETRVVDFGLASAGQQSGSRLTKSGLLIGTPEYMAPEQISSEAVDHRSDLYSVGVLMYEMLTGVKPFTAETPVKVLFLHLEGEAVPAAQLAPRLPKSLLDLVMSTMARNREDRPATAQELHDRIVDELAMLKQAA